MALAAALVGSAAADAPAALQRRFTPTGSSDNTNTCTDLELIWFRSGFEPQGPSLGLMGVSIARLDVPWTLCTEPPFHY